MKTAVFTVGSVTYALKAKKLLAREGLVAKLVKTDASADGNGCAYGIEFPARDFYTAASILRSAGIYYEIYEK